MLCEIFNDGLRGDFRHGRDLMLMSRLQENISQMDISTQILFNRAMAQLGLASFRLGMFAKLRRASASCTSAGASASFWRRA
jgi:translation initiation factor 3 subunit C